MTTLTSGPGEIYLGDRLIGVVGGVTLELNDSHQPFSGGTHTDEDLCRKRTGEVAVEFHHNIELSVFNAFGLMRYLEHGAIKLKWKSKRGPRRIVSVWAYRSKSRVST